MIDVIGDILPQAVAMAVSIAPILAVVLILGTPKAGSNGPIFLLGWFIGTLALGIVIVLLGSGQDYSEDSGPTLIASLLMLLLGGALLWFAIQQWRTRPRAGEDPELPQWMKILDTFTTGKAFGLALFLAVVNTKNLPIAIGVGITVVRASLGVTSSLIIIVITSVIASLGVAFPLFVYFGLGERAEAILSDMRTWLAAYNNIIMAVLFLIIGMNFVGKGLGGLF
jgi:hypothetical protein